MSINRLTVIVILLTFVFRLAAQEVVKIGIIGLDTSHSPAFIKMLNYDNPLPEHRGFKIVAAYPYGSKKIASSAQRINGYVRDAIKNDVKIVNSIAELLQEVDCVMLETNDGNLHLEQAAEVIKSGKPLFVDKPVAANLTEAIAIFLLAKKYNVKFFSASPLRYSARNQEIIKGKYGKVLGADCYSPSTREPSHDDFAWYGIHGIELLFTVMGQGCKSVSRVSTDGTDLVVGVWADGRIGTYRGGRTGKQDFGGTAFCEKGTISAGGYEGNSELLTEILKFFKTKNIPFSENETLEIFTFMDASDESIRNDGKPVDMDKTFKKALKEATKVLNKKKLL
ncbi:MAG: Gfo/Idh/MocA family oxidoreductase [Tannerella sp.]|nr:Gfo/Idh/MocA family oxidoreductase [Tannerella sp.]